MNDFAKTSYLDHLTEKQVAQHLGVSVRTLQAQRQRGSGIPYLKIGRSVRYASADVERYLIQQRRSSTSQG